jgi:hypothetical protein
VSEHESEQSHGSTSGSAIRLSGSGNDTSSESNSDIESEHGPTSEAGSAEEGGSGGDGVGSDPGLDVDDGVLQQGIAEIITKAQRRNIRHDAAEVAASAFPFESAEEAQVFVIALDQALSSGERPANFALNDEYRSLESYTTGRSSKPLVITLPHDIWFPRIVVWCTALDLLKRLSICRDVVSQE